MYSRRSHLGRGHVFNGVGNLYGDVRELGRGYYYMPMLSDPVYDTSNKAYSWGINTDSVV